jgi:hypothetical protein
MSLAQQDMQKWIQILKGNDKSKWDGAINDFYGFSASYVWLIFYCRLLFFVCSLSKLQGFQLY